MNKSKVSPNLASNIVYGSGTTAQSDQKSEELSKEWVQAEILGKIEDFKRDQNIKLIEFLGIFTAILAFITISGKIVIDNLNLFEMIILIPVFALCLLLFVLGIDQLIKKDNNSLFKWAIICLIILLAVALAIAFMIKDYKWIGIIL